MARKRLPPTERRAAILDAARQHFSTTTFQDASVSAIAADAGASQSLIFHYFSTKAGLFASLIDEQLTHQRHAEDAALANLDENQPVRYRVETLFLARLDAIAADPLLLAGPGEPEAARGARRDANTALAQKLADIIGINDFARHRWAVTGIVGFLGRAATQWAAAGFPADQRHPIIEATVGALEGALGDWKV